MGSFVRLKPGEPGLAGEGPLLKARDHLTWLDAQSLLHQARLRAAEIEAEAQKIYTAEKARGYADGRDEAAAEATERMVETLERTVTYMASVENRMVELVAQATEKVLGELPPEAVVRKVVANAIGVMRNQKQVTLKVHPDLVESVRANLGDTVTGLADIGIIEVEGDRRLGMGGCILESEIGVVDASLATQVEALRKAMAKAFLRA